MYILTDSVPTFFVGSFNSSFPSKLRTMSRPRSNSDPSENKPKAPLAPSLASAKSGVRTAVSTWGQKSSSGYVGLSNQGATCYLNSLLQCLYMTPEFRHALFTWKYKPPPNTNFDFDFLEEEDTAPPGEQDTIIEGLYDAPPEHCIPFQLQCLFSRLHKSCRGACSTKPLTKSFHWDDGQAFQQHDVQVIHIHLFMRLCDIYIIIYLQRIICLQNHIYNLRNYCECYLMQYRVRYLVLVKVIYSMIFVKVMLMHNQIYRIYTYAICQFDDIIVCDYQKVYYLIIWTVKLVIVTDHERIYFWIYH